MKLLLLGPPTIENEAAWIKKVTLLTKKQSFDLILVLGSISDLETYSAAHHVPTYFVGHNADKDMHLGN